MKYYDFNLKGSNYQNDLKLLNESHNLNWDYVKIMYSQEEYTNALNNENILRDEEKKLGINFDYGLEINTNNPEELRKLTRKNRSKIKYISCLGGNLKINRAALENRQIDTLSRPYYHRRDSGMNHVLAKLARDNNVCVELSLKDILTNHLSYRAKVISYFKEILLFQRKYKFPLILTSGATNFYDTKSVKDFLSIFNSIGFTNEEINNAISTVPSNIIDFNNNRENMVIEGVCIVDDDL
ncbi:ribonuclease P protein component 3 [Methanobrevibacter sp. UBA417]|jgi:ribonuclease P/MRP protein subunit RPP1|uniref:ribonuclease P protein component 3 n=1 Tax=Methanobrevibacter sp. UBA417 TaxID=1915487 RepID=UPI0039B90862